MFPAGPHGRMVLLSAVGFIGMLMLGFTHPAAARDGEADELPRYSACVGPALESAGFQDIAGYSGRTVDAINCLAYYGITSGTTEGFFSPRDGITRGQMALFMIRAAEPAGVALPAPSDQGFTDINRLPDHFRDAINQMALLGITSGKTPTTFDPGGLVTRRQMAKFLSRFLELASVGVGGADIREVIPDDEVFDDIGALPRTYYRDVRVLYEMGITAGTADYRFHPDRHVTRSQMALFVTRMLAHTNARPAGLTFQAEEVVVDEGSTVEMVVSVRDHAMRPVADTSLDLFHASPGAVAFNSGGDCYSGELIRLFGDILCEVDRNDRATDEDGNLVYDLQVGDHMMLWAWAGNRGDDFSEGHTDYVSMELTVTKPAVALEVISDLHPAARKSPFGRRVEFTLQLVDGEGDPVAEEDVEITVRSEETTEGRLIDRRTRDYSSDRSGRVEFSFRVRRPRSAGDGDEVLLVLTITDSGGHEVVDEEGTRLPNQSIRLVWSGEDEEPTVLVLEQQDNYQAASSSGTGASNTVTATLLDQYGDPVRGETIHFVSDDEDGLGRDPNDRDKARERHRKTTDRRGEASLSYTRDDSRPGIEAITVFTENRDVESDTDHYWVVRAPTDQALTSFEVLFHDRIRNILVVGDGSDGPYLVGYDHLDQFNVDDEAERYTSFRDNLEVGDRIDLMVQSHDPAAVNRFVRYE